MFACTYVYIYLANNASAPSLHLSLILLLSIQTQTHTFNLLEVKGHLPSGDVLRDTTTKDSAGCLSSQALASLVSTLTQPRKLTEKAVRPMNPTPHLNSHPPLREAIVFTPVL